MGSLLSPLSLQADKFTAQVFQKTEVHCFKDIAGTQMDKRFPFLTQERSTSVLSQYAGHQPRVATRHLQPA